MWKKKKSGKKKVWDKSIKNDQWVKHVSSRDTQGNWSIQLINKGDMVIVYKHICFEYKKQDLNK